MSSIKHVTKWENAELINRNLKYFQIESLNMADKYISSRSDKHALIKLPTGTGKTLIIYMLANFYKRVKNILIVTPSETVKTHLIHEMKEGVKNKLNITDIRQKEVNEIFPRNINEKIEFDKRKIYVTTIQSLSHMQSNKEIDKIEKLKECIDLVVFDEGHMEPAIEWKKAIRELEKKVILFSATPIRGDKNKFKIDAKYTYNFSLSEAMEQNYIRTPIFLGVEQNRLEDFIDYIVEKSDELEANEKVIIRFKSRDDIIKAHDYLKNVLEKNVIAIHEEFSGTNHAEVTMVKKVPKNLREVSYKFWLHQYKLIEGVDDSSFRFLALFDGFSNARSLVQQVGRVLRQYDFGGETKENSFVIYNNSSKVNQEELWHQFLYFEEFLNENNSLISFNFNEYLKKVVKSQPNIIYLGERALPAIKLINMEQGDDYLTKYKIPLRANVLKQKNGKEKTLSEISQEVIVYLDDNDRYIIDKTADDERSVFLCFFAYYSISPYLTNQSFIEPETGLLLIKISGDYIFIYNSSNNVPQFFYEFATPLNSSYLERVYDEDSIVKQISIQNGNISKNEVTRNTINAEDINQIAPNITDRYKFATTVNGKISISEDESRNRYVGFKNGRIVDSNKFYSIGEYLNWLDSLVIKFERVIEHRNIFERYAPVTEKPDDVSPYQILLDIDEDLEMFDNDEQEIQLLSKMAMVNEEGKFTLNTESNQQISFQIEFNDDKNSYIIKPLSLINIHLNDNLSLSKYLNNSQSFQIITRSIGYIYTHHFFVKIGIEKEKNLLKKIFLEYQLKDPTLHLTEKGFTEQRKVNLGIQEQISEEYREDWDLNSLFYLLSSRGEILDEETSEQSKRIVKILNELDYLICEDLDYEIADFIGIKNSDGERRVYFIHAKSVDEKKGIAASSFQDVCSQIIKNLDFVHPLSESKPNLEKWNRPWKQEKYKVNRPRITTFNNNPELSPTELWELIKDIQQDQEGEVYVWALLANMLSLSKFDRVTVGNQDDEGIIPLIYILSNTWTQVQNVGAKFEVLFNKIEVQ